MRKIGCLVSLLLLITLAAPALAQTTGVAVDGKTYAFFGGEGTYEADGKTFIIGKNTVTIREAGKEERICTLDKTADRTEAVQEEVPQGDAVWIESATPEAVSLYTLTTEETISLYTVATEDAEAESVDPERFSEYAPFGLTYDSAKNALYYQGKRVRVFEDTYPLDDNSCAALQFVDDQGVIDVEVQRDVNQNTIRADGSYAPGGAIVELRVLSEEEFAKRELVQWMQSEAVESAPKSSVWLTEDQAVEGTAAEGTELTPEEKAAFYAPYQSVGITYDRQTDTMSYQGKSVRHFMDIKKSNGEPLSSGRFQGTITSLYNDNGEIDIETIRDFTRTDADGYGVLTGIAVQTAK